MLQIPLRARLADPVATRRLLWRRLVSKWNMPRGTFLTDAPVRRLPRAKGRAR